MGYYTIRLTPNASRLCTIVFPWGQYEYLRLPMGVHNSPGIFQHQMSSLMAGLEFVRTYLDDILLITKNNFIDHLNQLDLVLQRIQSVGLKINAPKSFFGRQELEYLGFWITREGIRPVTKKVEAFKLIQPPKTRKQLRSFIGIVNYYRDMWRHRSEILAPLSRLTSKKVKWKWTEVEQNAFDRIKKVITRDVLLSYPNFSETFIIHTDASAEQLGSVISQNGKPIAFYSRKLNSAQKNYTTGERELLSIVETLKEFKNILFGQKIKIFTDHKNLTFKTFNTERVTRWRLLVEEYGPELVYIKGAHNVVADSLSRLPILDSEINLTEQDLAPKNLANDYDLDDLSDDVFPIDYKLIAHAQRHDNVLLKSVRNNMTSYDTKTFRGSDILCRHGLICVPKVLQKRLVEWYHDMLCHPGVTRLIETLKQHFNFPNLKELCVSHIKRCDICQRHKKQKRKYGKLPPKTAETQPWQTLCVDLIGPYTIRRRGKKTLTLRALTMIDPATGWFEVVQYNTKGSDVIADLLERSWLCRYPWPEQIIYDNGSEFIGPEFQSLIKSEYHINCKPTSVKNPQANAILERVHQVVGNMLRTFELEDIIEDDPFDGILSAIAWAIRSTYHTTLQATPGQLVFGRDMILNVTHIADWHKIKQNKQKKIDDNNRRENQTRIDHDYSVDEYILIKNDERTPKLMNQTTGPFKITKVHTNGTVTIQRGVITERINIRRLLPYVT